LLVAYSAGQTSRRRTIERLGLAAEQYSAFVELMRRFAMPWPSVDFDQAEAEAGIVADAISEALTADKDRSMRTKLILPDTGPLFSFSAVRGGLDLLLAPALLVILTDYIEWEAIRSGSATAKTIQEWIDSHCDAIRVIETERGQDRIAKERAGIVPKKERRNIGEQTIFEAISEGDIGEGPLLFLFEEEKFVDPSFYGRYAVHSVTTLGFLVGLERSGIIADADGVFRAMRSNGREGVKGVILDRPYRERRDGTDTTWRTTPAAASSHSKSDLSR
jgi:hypothetical protein